MKGIAAVRNSSWFSVNQEQKYWMVKELCLWVFTHGTTVMFKHVRL